nr:MAG TPA: hypothetical protein [Caudoviricetes sp.]
MNFTDTQKLAEKLLSEGHIIRSEKSLDTRLMNISVLTRGSTEHMLLHATTNCSGSPKSMLTLLLSMIYSQKRR